METADVVLRGVPRLDRSPGRHRRLVLPRPPLGPAHAVPGPRRPTAIPSPTSRCRPGTPRRSERAHWGAPGPALGPGDGRLRGPPRPRSASPASPRGDRDGRRAGHVRRLRHRCPLRRRPRRAVAERPGRRRRAGRHRGHGVLRPRRDPGGARHLLRPPLRRRAHQPRADDRSWPGRGRRRGRRGGGWPALPTGRRRHRRRAGRGDARRGGRRRVVRRRTLRAGEEPVGREHLVLSHGAWTAQRAVRTGDWLYLRTWHDGFHGLPEQLLFDLATDPHERARPRGDQPDVCATRPRPSWWPGGTPAWRDSPTGVDPLDTVLDGGRSVARPRPPPRVRRTPARDRTAADGPTCSWPATRVKPPARCPRRLLTVPTTSRRRRGRVGCPSAAGGAACGRSPSRSGSGDRWPRCRTSSPTWRTRGRGTPPRRHLPVLADSRGLRVRAGDPDGPVPVAAALRPGPHLGRLSRPSR